MADKKVNTYTAELKLEKYIEQAMNNSYIEKPISWALYKTWRWANNLEKKREDSK